MADRRIKIRSGELEVDGGYRRWWCSWTGRRLSAKVKSNELRRQILSEVR